MDLRPAGSRAHTQGGFSFLMLVVLVAALGLAIGVAVALGARQLDARRTAETRNLLPVAFRCIFPYPLGSLGADLKTDFAYMPDAPTVFQRSGDQTRSWDLRALVDRTQVGVSDAAFATPPPASNGSNAGSAWNGPYWQAAVDGFNRPLDAWGRPLELRYVTSPSAGWIVHSAGANGLDDTSANSGAPGGDDLVYPSPPYTPPPPSFSTYTAEFNFAIVLRNPATCGMGSNNEVIGATITYQDATSTQTGTILAASQMHRQGSGKPNRFDNLRYTAHLRSSPVGTAGSIQVAVTGGCPDTVLSAADFMPTSSSLLTYLGSSTSGATTTYSFRVNYNAAGVTPWPITIRP